MSLVALKTKIPKTLPLDVDDARTIALSSWNHRRPLPKHLHEERGVAPARTQDANVPPDRDATRPIALVRRTTQTIPSTSRSVPLFVPCAASMFSRRCVSLFHAPTGAPPNASASSIFRAVRPRASPRRGSRQARVVSRGTQRFDPHRALRERALGATGAALGRSLVRSRPHDAPRRPHRARLRAREFPKARTKTPAARHRLLFVRRIVRRLSGMAARSRPDPVGSPRPASVHRQRGDRRPYLGRSPSEK